MCICVENTGTLLDEMRYSRTMANAAFMEFTQYKSYFGSYVFCFYEGEDGKYYNQRIKSIIGDKIIFIKVGNKNETLKVWRMIRDNELYINVTKMFFVDMDMDGEPFDINSDLYITPCYSIENFYVSKKCFGNILEAEFSLSQKSTDYQKYISLFEDIYKRFCEEILEFNALVLIRKQKDLGDKKVNIKDIKTNKLINIKLDSISQGEKYDAIINDLKQKLSINNEEVDCSIQDLKSRGNFSFVFRGKNQLDFLVCLIKLLKESINNENKQNRNNKYIKINITNNRLSELSQYADTPNCLISFINQHKISREFLSTKIFGEPSIC